MEKDCVVLITGSSRGIGAALAMGFARSGSRIAINYFQSNNEVEDLASKIWKMSGSGSALAL